MKKHLQEFEHGTVVVSKVQTNGKGRGTHTWESIEGNLYLTYLLKENVSYDTIFEELMRTSITCIKVLHSFGLESRIKYPNDILVNNMKISGILTETYGNIALEGIIVGAGINVNQTDFKELNSKATSIYKLTGNIADVQDVLQLFVNTYNELLTMDVNGIYSVYKANSMVIGKSIDYNGKSWLVEDILIDGKLVLKHKEDVMRLSFSEVNLKELYNETNN